MIVNIILTLRIEINIHAKLSRFMKKLTLTLSLISSLFLFSCSSDDDGTDSPLVIAKNKQYPVNFTLNIEYGSKDGILGTGDISKVIFEPRTQMDKLGNKGLIVYSDKNLNIAVYDLACPNCWNGNILTSSGIWNGYQCNTCRFFGFIDNGFGQVNHAEKVYMVKYAVFQKDKYLFEISNPK